jgi:hypothetical protein
VGRDGEKEGGREGGKGRRKVGFEREREVKERERVEGWRKGEKDKGRVEGGR